MKNLITFLIFTLGVSSLYSQCVREISTNPNNPYNLEWEGWYPTGTFAGSFINTGFSWYPNASILIPRSQLWNTTFQDPNAGDLIMEWPYATDNGQHSHYLYRRIDPSTLDYEEPIGHDTPIELRDYHWEDGWELLYLNIGRLANGERIDQKPGNSWDPIGENPNPSHAPYFVLYNRYRGTLRVFFNVWFEDNSRFDNVTVQLRFDESAAAYKTMSAVLRHGNGIDQAMDQKTIVDNLKSPRRGHIINHDQWYVADFQLGYDVCQCKIQSKFVLSFQVRDSVSADLFSRSISLENSIIDDANGLDKTFFQTMVNEDGSYAVPGNQIFKSFDDLTTKYKEALNKYNDYNDPINQIKIKIAKAGNSAILGGISKVAIPTGGVKSLLLQSQLNVFGNTVLGPKDEKEAEKWTGKLQAGLKGILGDEFDFFSAALNIAPKASAPQVPVATFTDGKIIGTLTDEFERYSVPLFVPGTKHDKTGITSQNFPLYNNVLGLFAMIKTPSVKMYSEQKLYKDFKYVNGNKKHEIGTQIQNNKLAIQVNPLKYAVNPALDFDMEKTTFNGAMIITFKSEEVYDASLDPLRSFLLSGFSNFKLNHRMIDDDGYLISEYVSDFYDLETISNQMFQLDAYFMGGYEYQDDFLGTYEGVPQKQIKQTLQNVKLRVMADMYFDQIGSNGVQVNNFQLFTYEIYDVKNDNGNIVTAVEGDGGTHITDPTPWVKSLGHITIDGLVSPTMPIVWEVIGNTIYVKAEKVLLKNLVGPIEGFNLVIVASSIDMEPDAELALNTELRSTQFYDNPKSVLTTVNEEFYASNCNGDEYKANISASYKYKKEQELINGVETPMDEETKLLVYPNPANQEVNIKVTSGRLKSCNVRVLNVSGQVMIQERVGNELLNGFAIGVENLSNGYYILELFSDDGFSYRKQIVISH